MPRVARRIIEERHVQLLLLIAQHAGGDGLTRMSNSEIATTMGITIEQARNACRSLAEKGLLESRPQYLYNGAQVENAYRLTPSGCKRLMAQLKEERSALAHI